MGITNQQARSPQIWRYLLVAVGACFALLGTGIARDWVQIENAALPFSVSLVCWVIAVIGWRVRPALFAFGTALVLGGVVLFFVMPIAVNNGSGQDAVALFATVAGAGTALLGFGLLGIGGLLALATRNR